MNKFEILLFIGKLSSLTFIDLSILFGPKSDILFNGINIMRLYSPFGSSLNALKKLF